MSHLLAPAPGNPASTPRPPGTWVVGALEQVQRDLATSPRGRQLLEALRRAEGTVTVASEAEWMTRGYPQHAVAVALGTEVLLRESLLANRAQAATMLAHEAVHVVDNRFGTFRHSSPARHLPGSTPARAARDGARAFERAGLPPREGSRWARAAYRDSFEVATEAHAYRDQAIVARQLGVHPGSALHRGAAADGRPLAIRDALQAIRRDPVYAQLYLGRV